MDQEVIKKIIEKREYSQLPIKDVEIAFSHFEKKEIGDLKKIKLTRELLHKAYGAFGSKKLFIMKERDPEWILRKHQSTRERLPHYSKIYERIIGRNPSVIFDLGAGVNGFSLKFMSQSKYIGIEGIGQLVHLMNIYFAKKSFNAKAIHLSLFDLDKIKNLIKKEKGRKIVFLLKVLDSLEMLKRDYSKELLLEITPLVNRVVVSFATESMIKRKRFHSERNWIINFIAQNFRILDNFEIKGEKFILFTKK